MLLAVDDPLVAFEHGRGGDVLGVRRGVVHFGHGVGRADLAIEQGLQPALFLRRRANTLQHLHVAGVGRRAVHAFTGQRGLAQFGGDVGVVQIGQAFAGVGIGQEEVPQAFFLGLVLGSVEQVELPGRVLPAVGADAALAQRFVLGRHGNHGLGDEALDVFVQRQRLGRHAQVVQFVGRIQRKGRGGSGWGVAHGVVLQAVAEKESDAGSGSGPERVGRVESKVWNTAKPGAVLYATVGANRLTPWACEPLVHSRYTRCAVPWNIACCSSAP